LAAFEKAQARLREEGITVVAASTDPLDKARETVAEHGLTFPVGYGLPLTETAARFGAFYDPKRGVLHATGFVVRPDGTIAVGQYSSGPIGRLVWQDVLGLVQFYKRQAAAQSARTG
jgi:peroxiredoxin